MDPGTSQVRAAGRAVPGSPQCGPMGTSCPTGAARGAEHCPLVCFAFSGGLFFGSPPRDISCPQHPSQGSAWLCLEFPWHIPLSFSHPHFLLYCISPPSSPSLLNLTSLVNGSALALTSPAALQPHQGEHPDCGTIESFRLEKTSNASKSNYQSIPIMPNHVPKCHIYTPQHLQGQ